MILLRSSDVSGQFFAPNLSWLNKMHWLKVREYANQGEYSFSKTIRNARLELQGLSSLKLHVADGRNDLSKGGDFGRRLIVAADCA